MNTKRINDRAVAARCRRRRCSHSAPIAVAQAQNAIESITSSSRPAPK